MSLLFTGRVQSGHGDAANWLSRFNAAYSRKLGMPVFPGRLTSFCLTPSIGTLPSFSRW